MNTNRSGGGGSGGGGGGGGSKPGTPSSMSISENPGLLRTKTAPLISTDKLQASGGSSSALSAGVVTSISRRMSWLFTSPWSESASSNPSSPTLTPTLPDKLHAPPGFKKPNPTTVSAPGGRTPSLSDHNRRRGSSISSIGSAASIGAGGAGSKMGAKSTTASGDKFTPTTSAYSSNTITGVTNSPQVTSKNPEEYAIQVLFMEFAKASEAKLAWARNLKMSEDPDLTGPLKMGADPEFDRLLRTLGALARQRPKAVVEALMLWRKSKINQTPDVATLRAAAAGEPISKDVLVLIRERNSLVSIFILCRALIEVVKQLKPEALAEELGIKLEEMVFNQLKTSDPILIARSSNRTAIMSLFAELIGWLSNVRFASVSDRFIAELENLPIAAEIADTRENKRTEMIIRSMRFLKLKIYPETALEETSEFLLSLAKFFTRVKSMKVKHAYAELFVELLLPLASVAVAEVNFPSWTLCVETLYPKAVKMCMKPKHAIVATPLIATLLCVSRREFFLERWLLFIEAASQKLKDKFMRQLQLSCCSRLLWVYLFRCRESFTQTEKKLENVLRLMFPPGRKQVVPSDTPLEHFVRIVYFILMKDIEHGLKTVILPLLGVDTGSGIIATSSTSSSSSSSFSDSLAPERCIIALRAAMLVLRDVEQAQTRPGFPPPGELIRFGGSLMLETLEFPANELPDQVIAGRKSVQNLVEKLSESMAKILANLDQSHGHQLLLEDRYLSHRNMYSISNAVVIAAKELATTDAVPSYSHLATLTVSYSKEKQPYFDLLRCCTEMIPRILPQGIAVVKLAEMLTRYVVHVDQDLARAAADGLRRLATCRNSAHLVVASMSRLMDRLSDRYSELLYAAFVEEDTMGRSRKTGLLKLYVDLLEVWAAQLGQTTTSTIQRTDYDSAVMWNLIDETEANGLFLLCGHSAAIRRCAVMVLRLAADVERKYATLRGDSPSSTSPHIFDLLEGTGDEFIAWSLEYLKKIGLEGTLDQFVNREEEHPFWRSKARLRQLAESENPLNARLWTMLFPALVSLLLDRFPVTVAFTRAACCNRLSQMQSLISWTADLATKLPSAAQSTLKRGQMVSTDFIEQWAVYLVFSCATITVAADGSLPMGGLTTGGTTGIGAARKRSKGTSVYGAVINTARDLFSLVLPYLQCDHIQVREAVVEALGRVNVNVFPLLMDELSPLVKAVMDEPRVRRTVGGTSHQASSKKSKRIDRLRVDLTRIYRFSARFMRLNDFTSNNELVDQYWAWIRETKAFLMMDGTPLDLNTSTIAASSNSTVGGISTTGTATGGVSGEDDKLKDEFCHLVAVFYQGIFSQFDPGLRIGCWKLIEEWSFNGTGEVKMAAIKALCSLCKGSLMKEDRGFTVGHMLAWIDGLYGNNCASGTVNDKLICKIAKDALETILEFNWEDPATVECFIHRSYTGDPMNASTKGYFSALVDFIVLQHSNSPATANNGKPQFQIELSTVLSLVLLKVGDPCRDVRLKAHQLLRTMVGSKLPYLLEVPLLSELATVYKQEQLLLSTRLAWNFPGLTHQITSELMMRMENLTMQKQQDMLWYARPWIANVTLNMEEVEEGEEEDLVSHQSHIFLNNMFYLTIRYGDPLHKELESLWAELVTSSSGNVVVILRFLLNLGMEKRTPALIPHAKKIVVFLARLAPSVVVESLLGYLKPRLLVPEIKEDKRPFERLAPDMFIANLDAVLFSFPKRQPLSLGLLATLLLTDLAVEMGQVFSSVLPLLLHAIVIQVETGAAAYAYQEDLKRLLGNLIYALFFPPPPPVTHMPPPPPVTPTSPSILAIRQQAELMITSLQKSRGKSGGMEELIISCVNLFSHLQPDIAQKWGETSLRWATQCPLREAASRSFRVFRTLTPSFNQPMMAEILARLSNTISDATLEIQDFAMEILSTLRVLVDPLEEGHILHYPEVFWGSLALLYTKNKREYQLGLQIVESVLAKLDIDEPSTQELLTASFPVEWMGEFEGIQPLLLKGLKSFETEPQCIRLVNSLMQTDGGSLIDPSESRGLLLILANLPRLISAMDPDFGGSAVSATGSAPGLGMTTTTTTTATVMVATTVGATGGTVALSEELLMIAGQLFEFTQHYGLVSLRRVFESFGKRRFRTKDDFLKQTLTGLREYYFPEYEWEALSFLTGLLTNSAGWFKRSLFKILKVMLTTGGGLTSLTANPSRNMELVIAPLLQHLPTEFGDDALEVLEATMSFLPSMFSPSPPGANSTNKQHKVTPSTESGWFVGGDVDRATLQVRQNIQAVLTAVASSSSCLTLMPAPVLEFTVYDQPDRLSDFSTSFLHPSPAVVTPAVPVKTPSTAESSTHHPSMSAEGDAEEEGDENDEGGIKQMLSQLNELDAFFAADTGGANSEIDDDEELESEEEPF